MHFGHCIEFLLLESAQHLPYVLLIFDHELGELCIWLSCLQKIQIF